MDNVSCISANSCLYFSHNAVPMSGVKHLLSDIMWNKPITLRLTRYLSAKLENQFYCSGKQSPISPLYWHRMDHVVCAELQNLAIKSGHQDQHQKIIAARSRKTSVGGNTCGYLHPHNPKGIKKPYPGKWNLPHGSISFRKNHKLLEIGVI